MSGDERNQDRLQPHVAPTPQPDPPRPRFLGTADPDPVPLSGIAPGSPAEALALTGLSHPGGRPLRVELPTDPLALSPAAIDALADIVAMLDTSPGEKKAGHDGPAKSNREVEDDER